MAAYLRYFNSHAHVERDKGRYDTFIHCDYFNSHAHVERDLTGRTPKRFSAISTHTLTWSVTIALVDESLSLVISTHTLTWSVTSPFSVAAVISFISTHTLTWSVTNVRFHVILSL